MTQRKHIEYHQRFGKLRYLKEAPPFRFPTGLARRALCICDCGNVGEHFLNSLTTGKAKSCGCSRKGVGATHAKSRTRIYAIWQRIKFQCHLINKDTQGYSWNREHNISLCKKWQTFEGFYEDTADTYIDGYFLERIDKLVGFKKSNCRWVKKQTSCYEIIFNGENAFDASIRLGGSRSGGLVYGRLKNGWPIQEAFTTPKLNHKDRKKVIGGGWREKKEIEHKNHSEY